MKLKSSLVFIAAFSLCIAQGLIGAQPAKKPAAPAKQTAVPKNTPAPAAEPAPEAPIPDTVAVVEGVEIKKAELDDALTAVLGQSGRSPGELPAEQKSGAYRMILDDMIVDKLLSKRAADVKVPDEDVIATFKRVTANLGSDEEIKAQIEKSGQTVDKVKENIRSSLRQQQWVDAQIKDKTEVTDADAEDFFNKHPEQFQAPERVRASHILLAVKQDALPETVTKKQKEAEAIAARVKKGEDFTTLAKQLSEDPSAKENGGDLNFFAKEQMVPEFSEVAFKMKKDEVSDPVRSQFGYHIIKVTDRKQPEAMSLDQAKPRLLAFLKQQKKQAEVEKLVREIREKADVKINLPAAPTPSAGSASGEKPAGAPKAAAGTPPR